MAELVLDKRIIKTKKALKKSLFDLMMEKDFESLTTTEICEHADVSRNTFYNYYADKYALLEDCFSDYEDRFMEAFEALQDETNPSREMKKSFKNLLDTFFDMEEIYNTIPILSSFDLMSMYYQATVDILEKYEKIYPSYFNSEYDTKQLNSFLALGFWGFIHGNPHYSRAEVHKRAERFIADLIQSPIFID